MKFSIHDRKDKEVHDKLNEVIDAVNGLAKEPELPTITLESFEALYECYDRLDSYATVKGKDTVTIVSNYTGLLFTFGPYKIIEEPSDTCSACKGSGTKQVLIRETGNPIDNIGVQMQYAVCPTCNGTGKAVRVEEPSAQELVDNFSKLIKETNPGYREYRNGVGPLDKRITEEVAMERALANEKDLQKTYSAVKNCCWVCEHFEASFGSAGGIQCEKEYMFVSVDVAWATMCNGEDFQLKKELAG